MNDPTETTHDQTETPQGYAALDRNNEPISALVDGELEPKAASFLIRRLSDDEQMHQHWQRFHLVRACLQREFSGPVSLVGRVQAALENEGAPVRSGRFPSLVRLGMGGAVAASVAMVAVLGLANRMDTETSVTVEQAQGPGFVSQSTALDRQFNAPAVPAGFGADRSSGASSASPTQQRINRYMIRHSQAAGNNGFISFTPVLAAPAAVQSAGAEQVEDAERDQDAAR